MTKDSAAGVHPEGMNGLTATPRTNMAADSRVKARYSSKKTPPDRMLNSIQLICIVGTMTMAGKSRNAFHNLRAGTR